MNPKKFAMGNKCCLMRATSLPNRPFTAQPVPFFDRECKELRREVHRERRRVGPIQLSVRLLNDDIKVWFGKNAAPT